jgi:hypothetical protein
MVITTLSDMQHLTVPVQDDGTDTKTRADNPRILLAVGACPRSGSAAPSSARTCSYAVALMILNASLQMDGGSPCRVPTAAL